MGRYWRLGTWVALKVDVIPSQRPRLFRPDAYQEAQDNVGVQAVRACRLDQGNGLPGVGGVRDDAVVQLVVQLGELGPDLCLILAGDFLATPLAVRAGLEAVYTTPAARTMPMVSGSRQSPE
jgi:Na+(H+)/acetate symporter ActP